MSSPRVRFAPSPTGFFHIGSARTALFNWLFARKSGGTFVLRIEDTDRERNTPEALAVLIEGMRWLGLDWDEGPEKGGDYGPYFQSERRSIYDAHLERLRETGHVYEKDGAVFFKVSGQPQIIQDAIRGTVERIEEKDFVIYRSDGSPVFHFVNVVDDLTMGITHVIRGEDHLSNTSKHMELFQAFGATPPVFAHIPLILKQEGQGKMSKRDKGALVEDYQKRHFLPSAVRNYLCLLGWNPKDNREVMPINTIIEEFSFEGIQKGSAKFDEKKMAFINAEHLRNLPIESFCWMARGVLTEQGWMTDKVDENYLQRILELAQPKVNALDTLGAYIGFAFSDSFEREAAVLERIRKKSDPVLLLQQVKAVLETVPVWEPGSLDTAFSKLASDHGADKPFAWFPIVRWAVSGAGGGPDLIPLLAALGKDRVLSSMDCALTTLES